MIISIEKQRRPQWKIVFNIIIKNIAKIYKCEKSDDVDGKIEREIK